MQAIYEPWAVSKIGKEDLWGVKIIEGEYKGAIISINSLDFIDDNSGECALDFNFVQKPEGKTDEDLKSEDFNKTLTLIINDILEKAVNEYKDRDGDSITTG